MAGDEETPTGPPKIDFSTPYYLGSHDVPSAKISNVILCRDKYDDWKNSMKMSLRSRRKFGFIDGTISKPTYIFYLENWEVVYCTLVQWIRNTIDQSLLDTISYVEDAAVLWSELESQFDVVDGSKIQGLKTQLHNYFPPDVFEVVAFAMPNRPSIDWRGLRDKERGERRQLYCSHCETRGHKISNCYIKTQRFPQWWGDRPRTFTELRRARTSSRGSGVGSGSGSSTGAVGRGCSSSSSADQVVHANVVTTGVSAHSLISSDRLSGPFLEDDEWSRGPYLVASSCGAKYFLTIVDDYSRATWVYLLLDKTEVTDMFMSILSMVVTQFSKTVKTMRSDNGTEFHCMAGYFFSHGVQFRTSCVGTPKQNGRVEHKHRHILNVAGALRFQAHLPTSFWGECVLTAAYLINRTPSALLDNKTPYECLFGVSPSYANLRVFGCLCFAHNQNTRGDKFEKRGRKCISFGYPHNKKGWKLFDLEMKSYFVSRDVLFHENSFPLAPAHSSVPSNPLPAFDFLDDLFNGSPDDLAAVVMLKGGPRVGISAMTPGLNMGAKKRPASQKAAAGPDPTETHEEEVVEVDPPARAIAFKYQDSIFSALRSLESTFSEENLLKTNYDGILR
ncbi:uncharacterized protein LOC141641107 [Silene latifolia]|uniref:uncharacterized protein LOC141641107 n=1 Tax=Silene latifolia TaxID=37657 RepID=UPI003D7764C6